MNQNENKTTTAESLSEISAQLEKIITELLDSHPQKKRLGFCNWLFNKRSYRRLNRKKFQRGNRKNNF